MAVYKIATAVSFFVLSAAMLLSHVNGRFFPVLPVGVLLTITILVSTGVVLKQGDNWSQQPSRSLGWYIAPMVVIAVVYRLFLYFFPASIVGIDSPGYAQLIAEVANSGNIFTIDTYFYSKAPLGISFPAMFGTVGGGNSQQAMGIYPLILGLLAPLVVAILTFQIADADREVKMILAAGLAAVATGSVRLGYWPIAQSLGIVYWLVLLLFLTRAIEVGSKQLLFLSMIALVSQVFTHKLPLLIIFIVLLGYVAVSRLAATAGFLRSEYVITSNAVLVVGIVGVLLVIQWTFITEMIQPVIVRSRELLSTNSVQVSPPLVPVSPSSAIPPDGGVKGILLRRGHWLSLLVIGGIAWLVVGYRRFENRAARLLLICNSLLVILLAISIAGVGGPPSLRIISFLEPVLIPVIVLAFGGGLARAVYHRVSLSGSSFSLPSPRFAITAVVFVMLLTTQIFTPAAIPDFPGDTRSYTTAEEVSAQSFTYQHVDGPVHSDWFTKISEAPSCARSSDSSLCLSDQRQPSSLPNYRPIGSPLLNANVTDQGYNHVLFRTDVTYYRTAIGIWKLLWEPEQSLDRTYNRVYANGGAVFYERVGRNRAVDGNGTVDGNATGNT